MDAERGTDGFLADRYLTCAGRDFLNVLFQSSVLAHEVDVARVTWMSVPASGSPYALMPQKHRLYPSVKVDTLDHFILCALDSRFHA